MTVTFLLFGSLCTVTYSPCRCLTIVLNITATLQIWQQGKGVASEHNSVFSVSRWQTSTEQSFPKFISSPRLNQQAAGTCHGKHGLLVEVRWLAYGPLSHLVAGLKTKCIFSVPYPNRPGLVNRSSVYCVGVVIHFSFERKRQGKV